MKRSYCASTGTRSKGTTAYVTVFLFTGEQITGIVQLSEPVDNLEPAPLAA